MAAPFSVPLLCDVAPSGKLLEFGVDGAREVECVSKGVQAEFSKSESFQRRKGKAEDKVAAEAEKSDLFASSLLRLAIGLLGVEVHEKPNTWAEVWLRFQEAASKKLEIQQSPIQSICAADFDKTSKAEWQQQVLVHLRQFFDPKMVEKTEGGPPGMAEQLDLAEFTLERITHAVNLLQDPEGRNKPMLLQGYTEGMTVEVCRDLKQWLQKLAELLSFYHMFILDSEREKRCLREKLKVAEAQIQENEESHREALRRSKATDERWNEFKMKRRAEALLGINLDDEEEKIYSQREVDELYKKWTEQHVTPLLEELEELRAELERIGLKRHTTAMIKPPELLPMVSQTPGASQLLSSALFAASERSPDPLGDLLWQLGDRLQAGDDYKDVALAIQALPPFDPRLAVGQDAAVLSKNELDLLQTALKATSDYVQGELGEEVIRLSTHFATNSPELPQIVQTIQEISSRSPKAAARCGRGRRSVSVNTTGTMVLPTAERTASAPGDDDFRAELARLRAQLEAELRAAREEAERQRLRAEQALEKLEEEAKRADGLMAEMRKKLKTMQSVLQKTGLHKEAEEALNASGLTGFVKGRDVFERLYQDALRRMRVQAENQMRLLGNSSAAFLHILQCLAMHPMSAVNAALELHGAAVLLSSPLQVGSSQKNPGDHAKESKDQCVKGQDGEGAGEDAALEAEPVRPRSERIKTSMRSMRSLGSFGSLEIKKTQGISKRGINRAATLGSGPGQAWTSHTLRQTVFPGPESSTQNLPEPEICGRALQTPVKQSTQSGLLPRTRPGTGNIRSRPVASSERPASGRAKTSPMLTVSRLSGHF